MQRFINWVRQDWFNAAVVIGVTIWFVFAVLATLATPGDPFDDSPSREPVQYPHQ